MIAGITASTRRFQGGGFVIKTTDGAVVEIKGPGEVPGTHIFVDMDGYMYNLSQIAEVISWPEEKPVWLKANGVTFSGADHLTKVPDTLPAWITDMSSMFDKCVSFNQDISGWDTSNVTNMNFMFASCSSFNQDLSGWDTSNVVNMNSMFYGCSSFNGDLSGWDTSSVTNMSYMFYNCSNFNQDLSGWCVSNIPSAPSSFSVGATSWALPKPIWGTCPQEDSGGESGPDLGPGPWDIDPEHPEYFIPGRYIVSGSGSNFPGYAYIGTGSTPEAACNGLRSAMWGQLKDGVHSNQDAHNNRLTKDGMWCRIGTIWDDRITEAYIYDGIDAYIASGRDPMSAVRYDNGDEE